MVEKKVEEKESKTEEVGKKPSWIKVKPAELEKLIVDLAKEGNDPAKIGLILRDKHGIPKTRLFGKKISYILDEKGVKYKDEGKIIADKAEKLKSHISKNKHDHPASRSLTKKLWVLHKLEN
jgi:small subunit ribosomal protein S15